MITPPSEVVHDTSPIRPTTGDHWRFDLAPADEADPEAGLSSVDAFVLCALILAAVVGAATLISPAIQRVGTTISGLIP